MSQYLLLRDNKQSGPYNFDELTAKGLKAYDLIWIEGKSAAWRYPSEIQELKPFAPVVEEQPYDRFYKRPNTAAKKQQETVSSATINNIYTNENTYNNSSSSSLNNTKNNTGANVNSSENSPEKKTTNLPGTNRRVVVILPGGMNRPTEAERVVFHETVENKIAQPDKKATTLENKQTQADKYTNTKEPSATKQAPLYDPELVDFKKEPLLKMPEKKKTRSSRSKASKILAGTVALLTIGALIGWGFSLTLNDQETVTPIVSPQETVQLPEAQSVFNNESTESLDNQVTTAENQLIDEAALPAENQSAVDSLIFSEDAEPVVSKKPVVKTKKPAAPAKQVQQPATQPVTEPVEQSRTETTGTGNDSEEAEKKLARKNIGELIKVAKNDFKIGAFGGISNLQLKVTNSSPYPVDLVVVEVKYLLANKKEFKTENIYFKNLAPGATLTRDAPKSTRGIQVSSKVALITSKALGMYQASL
jgi:hypothetical protein